ncbi:MAG TPA: tyrosine--tRNA ligase [Acidimicrobiales bacterium]|nr:tyrosine--tRNA ligase [Acidimicrobiales bacterium]
MPNLAEDLEFRGLIHQVSDRSLFDLIERERITAYIGFDPSSSSLHLGNLLVLCTLRRVQLAGLRPIALAGGGTGLIGDPGGRDEERPLLSLEEHAHNMAGIRSQMERFLDFSPAAGETQALLLDNADWLCSMNLMTFLRDVGKHFTVNQMIARDSVRNRLERPDQGISFTEFSYMLLQAYDFLHLHDNYGCKLQMGASDQWGNIVSGVDLIRRVRGAEAFALTTPLVLKADGTKFGKSVSGAVWLDPARTSPYAMYQFLVRTEDAMVGTYLRYFTFLDHAEIEALDDATKEHPERREAQRVLAREVCALVHSPAEADKAERAAAALFSEEIALLDESTLLAVLEDAPSSTRSRTDLDGDGLDLVEALAGSGLVPSKSAARTTIGQGGAYVNNTRRGEGDTVTRGDLIHDRYVVLRRGRKDYHLLCFA